MSLVWVDAAVAVDTCSNGEGDGDLVVFLLYSNRVCLRSVGSRTIMVFGFTDTVQQ